MTRTTGARNGERERLYRLLVQTGESDIMFVSGVDQRPPAEVRSAWLAASKAMLERGRRQEHLAMLSNIKNEALRKKVDDGTEDPVTLSLDDVEAPPPEFAPADEQLVLSGREDGSGYVSVVSGHVLGIACEGPDARERVDAAGHLG